MPKIAFIGAGSAVFAKNLMGDILSFPQILIAKALIMSEAYLITSPELESEIAITQEYFANHLAIKWPNSEVRPAPEKAVHTLNWIINREDHAEPVGGFRIEPMTVAIHGGRLDKITEFAIWFRSIIPLSYKLAMMITSLNREPLELNSHTTSDDIIQHFGR